MPVSVTWLPKVTCLPSCQTPGSLRLFLPATLHSPRGTSTPGAFALGSLPLPPCQPSSEPLLLSASLLTQAPSLLGAPLSACRIPYLLLATFLPTIFSGHSQPPPASWSPVQASLSHHQGPSGENCLDLVPLLPPNPQQLYPATCVQAQKTLCALLVTHSPSLPSTMSHLPSFLPIPLACCPISLRPRNPHSSPFYDLTG